MLVKLHIRVLHSEWNMNKKVKTSKGAIVTCAISSILIASIEGISKCMHCRTAEPTAIQELLEELDELDTVSVVDPAE